MRKLYKGHAHTGGALCRPGGGLRSSSISRPGRFGFHDRRRPHSGWRIFRPVEAGHSRPERGGPRSIRNGYRCSFRPSSHGQCLESVRIYSIQAENIVCDDPALILIADRLYLILDELA